MALKRKEVMVIDRKQNSKILFMVLDGIGDRPCKGHPLTPLQEAKKSNLNRLAKNGSCGLVDPIQPGIRPGSGAAHLALFGYNPIKYYSGRGSLAALGVGINLKEGEIAIRTNFATLKKGKLIDRRAGRIEEEDAKPLARALNKIKLKGVKLRFEYVKEHRGVLILSGKGLSGKITDSDPTIGNEQPKKVLALSPQAIQTAKKVNKFIEKAEKVLEKHPVNLKRRKQGKKEANFVLTRGAGEFLKAKGFQERYGLKAACIATYPQYKGIARFVGMKLVKYSEKGFDYRNIKEFEEKLKKRFRKAMDTLKEHDFVFLHIKETDEAGEDGEHKTKTKLIEAIDRQIPILLKGNHYLVIASDHSTPCCIKGHSGDPIPLIISGQDVRKDNVKEFDEISCSQGTIGRINGINLMAMILDQANRLKKYGP